MNTRPASLTYSVPTAVPFGFADDFRAAAFGDARLNKRAARIAESVLRQPEQTLPVMTGGPAGAEGA